MKPILTKLCVFAVMTVCVTSAYGWGQKGHDVTCDIAQRHLTKKAKKKIAALLDDRSIVYWANWMDNASHTQQYAYTKTWHYRNVDEGYTFESMPLEPNGDVVRAIDEQKELLKKGNLSKEDASLALKFLVHLMGDLHCPMHMGHKSDTGGNKWQVQFFGKGTSLHGIWDSDVIESAHKWTHSEWAEELDILDKKAQAEITAGTTTDWGKETCGLSTKLYEATPVGSKLSYDYVSEWTPMLEDQLLKGGLRLASVLNEIFK